MGEENLLEGLDIDKGVEELSAATDPFEATGTKRAHYSPAEDGPFNCEHCVHGREGGTRCLHPEVIEDMKELGQMDGEQAIVEPGGCCEYEKKEK